jgi:hypothetical protein
MMNRLLATLLAVIGINVVPFAKRKSRSLNARGALAYLAKIAEGHADGIVEMESVAHLGRLLGWERSRTFKQLKAWETSGKVTVDRTGAGKLAIRILLGRRPVAGHRQLDQHQAAAPGGRPS